MTRRKVPDKAQLPLTAKKTKRGALALVPSVTPEMMGAGSEIEEIVTSPRFARPAPAPLPMTGDTKQLARRQRMAELVTEQGAAMHKDWKPLRGKLERFALLQEDEGPNGDRWLTTHESHEAAARAAEDDESPFFVVALYDLETKDSYQPVTTLRFELDVES